ncbi:unnamed protein product [Xylocopa violacea]|uniref:Succinate dehydrogenase assembly factor 4, mitochondrial n=1 Tax=Xylocopa violacea TaxID=135666 RepID=A0ABP1NUW6_XYLVO
MNILKPNLSLLRVNINMYNSLNKIFSHNHIKPPIYRCREFSIDASLRNQETGSKDAKEESIRMKQFHKKLKLQPIPRVPPRERFVDLVLVETDSSGELITDSEKDPTKWGDWQTGGRVSDF